MSPLGVGVLVVCVLAGIACAWATLTWWLDAPRTPRDTRHIRVARGLDPPQAVRPWLLNRWRHR